MAAVGRLGRAPWRSVSHVVNRSTFIIRRQPKQKARNWDQRRLVRAAGQAADVHVSKNNRHHETEDYQRHQQQAKYSPTARATDHPFTAMPTLLCFFINHLLAIGARDLIDFRVIRGAVLRLGGFRILPIVIDGAGNL